MEVLASVVCASEFLQRQLSENEESGSDDEHDCGYVFVLGSISHKRKPCRIHNYLNTISNYTAKEFQQHFRVTIDAYDNLLRMIGPLLEKQSSKGRSTIHPEKQLLCVIWLLATPDSYRSVGDRFDMSKSSLSVSFMRVIRALCTLSPQIIKWPSQDQIQQLQLKFQRMAGLPNCIGCVDGTFINIKAPKEDPTSYITRKHTYAMTLQGICDASLKFTDIFVGYPGSVHDNRIFRNSDIFFRIQNDENLYFPNDEYIIGDKAYPILSWCIPPYINDGNLTASKRAFNSVLAKTRQTIERTFALLFGRFRRLKFLDMNRTDCIPMTVLAACVLHNVCLDAVDIEVDNYIREGVDHVHNNHRQNHNREVEVQEQPDGRNKRDELRRLIYRRQN